MRATAKQRRTLAWFAVVAACLLELGSSRIAWADDSPDLEKPKPEFSASAGAISAKLIPRAKSTSVTIDFAAQGGRLIAVRDAEPAAAGQSLDLKDFRSGFFELLLDQVPPGAEARIVIASDFFTKSTQFWGFSAANATSPWNDLLASPTPKEQRVVALSFAVKDGGALDGDGKTDGRITLVGGPRDSFWGYALGTLFIRFFGIFIVLGVLQVGMQLSGKIFSRTAASAASTVAADSTPQAMPATPPQPVVDEKIAAAIAVALHLHTEPTRVSPSRVLEPAQRLAWAQHGRAQLMGQRLGAYRRSER